MSNQQGTDQSMSVRKLPENLEKEPSKKNRGNTMQCSLRAGNTALFSTARMEKSTIHRPLRRILRKSSLGYRERLTLG